MIGDEVAARTGESNVRMTPNQIVAHNLREARLLKGWTQEEAAQHLERYLGVRWSKSTFSAAERSDEVLAFSYAFELPVSWFFLPPSPENGEALSETDLRIVEAVLGWPGGQWELEKRVDDILTNAPNEYMLRRASFRHANTVLLTVIARMEDEMEKQADRLIAASESIRMAMTSVLEDLVMSQGTPCPDVADRIIPPREPGTVGPVRIDGNAAQAMEALHFLGDRYDRRNPGWMATADETDIGE